MVHWIEEELRNCEVSEKNVNDVKKRAGRFFDDNQEIRDDFESLEAAMIHYAKIVKLKQQRAEQEQGPKKDRKGKSVPHMVKVKIQDFQTKVVFAQKASHEVEYRLFPKEIWDAEKFGDYQIPLTDAMRREIGNMKGKDAMDRFILVDDAVLFSGQRIPPGTSKIRLSVSKSIESHESITAAIGADAIVPSLQTAMSDAHIANAVAAGASQLTCGKDTSRDAPGHMSFVSCSLHR